MDLNDKLHRISELRQMGLADQQDRYRIRSIMNGGLDGIYAVMLWNMGKQSSGGTSRDEVASAYGVDLPTVNWLHSGLEKTAQRVGRAPTLKPPFADTEDIREKFQKRADIVKGWDWLQRLELQFPQVGRWLPGYSYAMWVIRQARDSDGDPYPKVELRDPYDVYPGWFGPDQQPQDACVVRNVPLRALKAAYSDAAWEKIESIIKAKRGATGVPILNRQTSMGYGMSRGKGWEGDRTGIEVVEYYYPEGTCYIIPEAEYELGVVPNPLGSNLFVVGKRFSFDKPISQYHHVIGLMGMMAKLNMLGLIASEDSVFRETNIIGELESGTYERGRFAVNVFAPGSRVEKPVGDLQQQVWMQLDRLEKQLRIGATYDVSQDAISPNSFATGNAIRELGSSVSLNVAEYHMVLRHAIERVDSKRLEWAEAMWPNRRAKIYNFGGKESKGWYRPSRDIKRDHRTRRVYGAMATWEDGQKAVVGLQYLQAKVFDVETIQENVDGLEDAVLVNQRNRARSAEETLLARLAQRSEADPAADMALIEIMDNPSDTAEILKKYFTPQEPELSPEEQAFMDAAQQQQVALAGGGAGPGGAPPPVTSVLSRLEGGTGAAEGGVQTVGTLRR